MKTKYVIAAVIAPLIFVADQVTKHLATEKLAFAAGDHYIAKASVEVLPCCFHFKYVENTGAAWGILRGMHDSIRTPFFVLVSIVAVAFIIYFFVRIEKGQYLFTFALSFILGGALGNFACRLRNGYVVDFIDWHYHDKFHWPTFNIADSAITLGVILLLVEMLFAKKRVPAEERKIAG